MSELRCQDFEKRLDEWLAGTLPDFERGAMRRHEAQCHPCRELAGVARLFVEDARRDSLELPGQAYFADLRYRIEQHAEAEGLWEGWRRRLYARRPPLFRASQVAALLMVVLTTGLWTAGAAAPFLPRNTPEGAAAQSPHRFAAPAEAIPNLIELNDRRTREFQEILELIDGVRTTTTFEDGLS